MNNKFLDYCTFVREEQSSIFLEQRAEFRGDVDHSGLRLYVVTDGSSVCCAATRKRNGRPVSVINPESERSSTCLPKAARGAMARDRAPASKVLYASRLPSSIVIRVITSIYSTTPYLCHNGYVNHVSRSKQG